MARGAQRGGCFTLSSIIFIAFTLSALRVNCESSEHYGASLGYTHRANSATNSSRPRLTIARCNDIQSQDSHSCERHRVQQSSLSMSSEFERGLQMPNPIDNDKNSAEYSKGTMNLRGDSASTSSEAGHIQTFIDQLDAVSIDKLDQYVALLRHLKALNGHLPPLSRKEMTGMLMLSVAAGDEKLVRGLLEANADPNGRDKDGHCSLHYAAAVDATIIVKALLDAGADPNCKNVDGQTPLHVAGYSDATGVIHVLVNGGAEIDARDAYLRTPILAAAVADNLRAVHALAARSADVDLEDAVSSFPLAWAVVHGNAEMFMILAIRTRNINKTVLGGWSALHLAAYHGRSGVVEVMAEIPHFDFTKVDDKGRTPVAIAIERGNTHVANLLERFT